MTSFKNPHWIQLWHQLHVRYVRTHKTAHWNMDSLSRATSLKKMTLPSPSNHCIWSIALELGWVFVLPPPINAEILPDLILHEFCACSHRSYEFMCATSFSCPENIVLQESPKYHYPLQYFWAPFILFLSLRVRSMVTWVKCSTVFYSLYFAKSWIYILLAIHAKIGFPLETCTSQWLYR